MSRTILETDETSTTATTAGAIESPRAAKPAVRKEVVLFCLDMLVCAASPGVAIAIRYSGEWPALHVLPYLTFLPVWLLWRLAVAHSFGLYDFRHRLTATDHVFAGIGAAVVAVGGGYMLLAFVQLYYLPDTYLSRIAAAIDLAVLALWFGASRTIALAWLERSGARIRVLLTGDPGPCAELAASLRHTAPRLLEVMDRPEDAAHEHDMVRFESYLRDHRVDQVILAERTLSHGTLRDLLAVCDRRQVEVFLYPDLDAALLGTSRLVSLAGLPLVSLSTPLATSPYRFIKRATDVGAASAGLLLLLPAMLFIAMAIRLESAGPAFFIQERVGLRGRRFSMVKFRTMRQDDGTRRDQEHTTAGDPRITGVGRWLRKTRLDEAPQLWNVLRGDMSLVGPRPEMTFFVEKFSAQTPLYEHRFLVRPGLTGLAQIHGSYDSDYADKLRYDLIYINSVSFATDFRILMATIRIVFTGHGAK